MKETLKSLLNEMAYNRSEFKDLAEAHARGCLREFYKARLAEKNKGLPEDIYKWYREAKNLADQFGETIFRRIKGFTDRRKALDEVVADLAFEEEQYRGYVWRRFVNTYEFDPKVGLDQDDYEAYVEFINQAVDEAFEELKLRKNQG